MNKKFFYIGIASGFFSFLSIFTESCQKLIINGCSGIENRRFNEVVYPATHNGHSYLESPVQNQTLTIKEQLEKGIRATKLHVYYHPENQSYAPYVCHGVDKNMIDGDYLEKIVEKVPRLFRGWARDVLKQMEPLNELVRDACCCAYGTHGQKGMIPFKHCILDPARRSLETTLGDIKSFLDKNPNEIISLILEDHTESLEQIAQAFTKNHLNSYVHAQHKAQEWPTLKDMILNNKRLVVFVHGSECLPYSHYPWLHNLWDFAWDTEWSFQDVSELKDETKDIVPKRGITAYNARHETPKNKVFVVHHFITPLTGGSKNDAKKVNKKNFLQSRLERLTKKVGQKPTFVQVDFFEQGGNDFFEVIKAMNS